MSEQVQPAGARVLLPRWAVVAGSIAICLHLGFVACSILNAPSGPWWQIGGEPGEFGPPSFSQETIKQLQPGYLSFLKMNVHFHFESNRPGLPGVYYQAKLKDENGQVIETVTVPDPDANLWVRHRQERMAWWLTKDYFGPPPRGEQVPSPMVRVFVREDKKNPHIIRFQSVPEILLERGEPTRVPSDLTLVFADSYARYLCRKYGADKVELIRHTQNAIPVTALSRKPPPAPEEFEEDIASFGDLPYVQASPRQNR